MASLTPGASIFAKAGSRILRSCSKVQGGLTISWPLPRSLVSSGDGESANSARNMFVILRARKSRSKATVWLASLIGYHAKKIPVGHLSSHERNDAARRENLS